MTFVEHDGVRMEYRRRVAGLMPSRSRLSTGGDVSEICPDMVIAEAKRGIRGMSCMAKDW
jgi:hypothetical protein